MGKQQHLSDEDLALYVCSKDRNAYSEIVLRYQDKLGRYVRSFTRDDAAVTDVVQETLVSAYVHLKSFNPSLKFSSWIYRIAHNRAMNYFSRKKNDVHLDDIPDIPDEESLEEGLMEKEVSAEVQKAIALLPVEYASPLALHYLEGYSYKEISVILKLPVGTIGTRINRAKTMMKKICRNLKR